MENIIRKCLRMSFFAKNCHECQHLSGIFAADLFVPMLVLPIIPHSPIQSTIATASGKRLKLLTTLHSKLILLLLLLLLLLRVPRFAEEV